METHRALADPNIHAAAPPCARCGGTLHAAEVPCERRGEGLRAGTPVPPHRALAVWHCTHCGTISPRI